MGVDPELDYLLTLADARSCLGALADQASTVRLASYFELLLIELDRALRRPPGLTVRHGRTGQQHQ
ncbi:MAG TPA: hypothetical protein VNA32_09005 [Actinomycetota bacterium]|nr:hypothetical protein [Actinomycetota bacterium]